MSNPIDNEKNKTENKKERKDFALELGNNIKQKRIDRGMTQVDLARKANMSEKYIQEVEKGRKGVSSFCLKKILFVLDGCMNGICGIKCPDGQTDIEKRSE